MDYKYWFQGLPFVGLFASGTDPGTIKYWFQGLPATFIGTVSPPASSIVPIVQYLRRSRTQ